MELKKYELIDIKSRYLVNGYIRNIQKLLTNNFNSNYYYFIIPKDINYICCFFYYQFDDEFEPKLCNENIILSENNKSIKNNGSSTGYYTFNHQ